MVTSQLITLLSDFGLNDVYVGVMKGVIAQISPGVQIIDLTHEIPPQNITVAQFNLISAYPYFPPGTIHVAVVDPGVGGSRRAIAVELSDGFLVGPDNGLFTGLLQQRSPLRVINLTNRRYWRLPEPSNTFHGRDIFAPAAAHLAKGVPIGELGEAVDPATLVQSPIPPCTATATGFAGQIQHIDRFGNVITNIPGDYVRGKSWVVTVGKRTIPGCQRYNEVESGSPLALVGSHGWVEIAINGGDAHFQLRLSWNDLIKVQVQ